MFAGTVPEMGWARSDGRAPFEFPAHLQKWSPGGAMRHFAFHSERCKAAPAHLKLVEIQRMTTCEMCWPPEPNNIACKFTRGEEPK